MLDPNDKMSRLRVEAALDEMICSQRWADFQRIAVPLARELRPDLIANELTQDGGEDAYVAATPDGQHPLAVACSLTARWSTVEKNLLRILERKPDLTALWFFTPVGVRAITTDDWRALARTRFNVELTVFSREHMVQRLQEPKYEYLWRNHLRCPVPDGIALSVTPYMENGIRAFVDEYLKSELGPIAFGGRDLDFALLDEWLDDESAPSRYLLTAPAGRGKSALLVRWMERLQHRGRVSTVSDVYQNDVSLIPYGVAEHATVAQSKWQLVFVPISIRFNTHEPAKFYRLLSEQLARVARRPLAVPDTDGASFYLETARALLACIAQEGHRVLVVLDGLDEALRQEFDPTLFPRVLPSSVRILVSARWLAGDYACAGWSRRLEWLDRVKYVARDLLPLDESGIADVLTRMGASVDSVASDRALVTRLLELTEGEPLVLTYYVADLWRRGNDVARLTRADLGHMKPGFGAYFDRWLELQKIAWRDAGQHIDQRQIDAVLMLLAFAHGPVTRGDLLELLSCLMRFADPLVAQTVLDPIGRFVIGDGSVDHGYVLSHPKIGEHLRKDRFRTVEARVESVFAAWGLRVVAEVNSGKRAPAATPRYLLQFLRSHLLATRASASEYLVLIEDGWRRAWQTYDGGHSGFTGEVRAVLSELRTANPTGDLLAQLRCILMLSSIRSLGHFAPRELIVAAAAKGILPVGQAAHLAGFMRDPVERVKTLASLATQTGLDQARQSTLLSDALAAASLLPDGETRALALCAMLPYLSGDQRTQLISEVLSLFTSSTVKGSIGCKLLGSVAEYLTAGQLSIAIATARSTENVLDRCNALSCLVPQLSGEERRDLLAEMLLMAGGIGNDVQRGLALFYVGIHLEGEQRSEVAREIETCLTAKGEAGGADTYFRALTAQILSHEQVTEVLAAVKFTRSSFLCVDTLNALFPYLKPDQLTRLLLSDMEKIEEQSDRARLLSGLARHLNEEQLQLAWKAAMSIDDSRARENALRGLAPWLSGDRQRHAIQEALDVVGTIADDQERAIALGELAPLLSQSQLAFALNAVQAIRDDYAQARAMMALALQASAEERSAMVRIAFNAARKIGDPEQWVMALQELAAHLDCEQVVTALQISTTSFKVVCSEALITLIPYLPSDQIQTALEAAQRVPAEGDPVRTLLAIVPRMSEDRRAAIVQEAFAGTNAVAQRNWGLWIDRIDALAPHLAMEQATQALATARTICEPYVRVDALLAVAHALSDPLRHEVLCEAEDLVTAQLGSMDAESCGESTRVAALAVHLPRLSGERRAAAVHTAFVGAQSINEVDFRATLMARLAPYLDGENRRVAMNDQLCALKEVPELKSYDGRESRSDRLRQLAPLLDRDQLTEALAIAYEIHDVTARADALSALAQHLRGEQAKAALIELLKLGEQITRSDFLLAIRPFAGTIFALGGTKAVQQVHKAIVDATSWYP
jgi:hypothetical protein